MTYSFHVPGPARTERKRQRFIAGKGRVGSRTDEPDRIDFKARVAVFARQAIQAPLSGPLKLEVVVLRPKPTSLPKRPTLRCPWPWAWTQKPDCDNYAKILADSLLGIAYHDDAQVVELTVLKAWGAHGVTVTVSEVEEAAWALRIARTGWERREAM